MALAAELGAIAAGAREAEQRALSELGRDIGVALQMLDDLTGLTCERRRHKGIEDLRACRASWPWAWLAEQLDAVSYRRFRGALEAVVREELAPELLAERLCERIAEYGRAAVRSKLACSLGKLREVLGEPKGIRELESELLRLEQYDA
jgi:geranylgeranyl pyrophosphate synthase